ncbi:MAG: hypothetical protein ABIH11_07125 [Candidatus Altiarchaeota archaeon]
MDDLTPKKLAGILVEKHDRMITEYSADVERWENISILREKRDQLKHWVEDDKEGKFSKELEDTEKELSELEGALSISSRQQYASIKKSVTEHVEARNYWFNKLKELS